MNGRTSTARNNNNSSNNKSIIFIALGFLLIANVSCFLLFAVLFEPEAENNNNPIMLRRRKASWNTTANTATALLNDTFNKSMSSQQQQEQQKMKIPNILIFTHSINLLSVNLDDTSLSMNDEHYEELVALQANVRNIIRLHPEATVRFLTDEDCQNSIRKSTTNADELVSYFVNEDIGMFKADLCRGVALLETGGMYFDVDLGVRMNIRTNVLKQSTEFATIRVHPQSQYPGNFFQAFIAATPQHEVLRKYVDFFLQYYRGKQSVIHGGPVGVQLLKQAFDFVEAEQSLLSNTTHLNQTSEIWQEFLYNWDFKDTLLSHVPPPIWGTRRACKFIVVSAPKIPLTVPFYSRIANSRMCPMPKNSSAVLES